MDNEIDDRDKNSEPIPISSLKADEKKPGDEKIEEIKVDPKKKSNDNTAAYNIKSKSFIKDFVSQPTRGSEEDSSASEPTYRPGETVEDIRARLDKEASEEASKMTPEDFEDAADFIIDLIDMALVFGIRWYSMDVSDAEYKVPEEKLKKLKKHLARLLMKMGKKFPMGMLFLLAIIAAYATPVRKAYEHRKQVQQEKARKITKKAAASSKKEEEEEEEPKYIPLKKRRGGQPK